MKRLFALLVVTFGISFISLSQITIKGNITDINSGELLAGANIQLENTFKGVHTGKNGNFEIKGLKNGKYTLNISYLGYNNQSINLNLSHDTSLIIKLDIKAILEDEVIITATRADEKTPTTFINISKEDIEDVNFGQDIPFLLNKTPSVVTTSDAGAGIGYTGIRIRGTDINRINVTVNGIPLNDAESHGVYWVNMPDFASSIDNIQIQRGVGTSTNGAAAFGASINIQTLKLRQKPYAEINNSFGSFNSWKNSVTAGTGLIDGKWSFDARLSKISSDGYIDRAFSDLKSFYFSGSYYGKKSILKTNIFSGKEKTYQAWYGVPKDFLKTNRSFNPYTYDNETDNYQQDHYQLLYSYTLSKYININAAVHYTYGRGYYEQFREDDKFIDYGLNPIKLNDTFLIIGQDTSFFPDSTIESTDLIRQKWLDNDFYGFTYSLNYDNKRNLKTTVGGAWNRYDGDHFGYIIWAKYASNSNFKHEWYKNTGVKYDFNIFGKVSYQLINKMNLYVDLQYRKINYDIVGIHDDFRDLTLTQNFDFINPKCGIFYEISNEYSAYLSFAIANREPSRTNYRDADSNYSPESERLSNVELGFNYKQTNFMLNANVYYMAYKDQLVLTGEINDVGAAIMANVPESYRTGIELLAGAKLLNHLDWDANITLSRNKIKDFTEYVDDWISGNQISKNLGETDLAFSPNLIFSNQITYELVENFKIILSSKYVSDQYIDNTSSDERKLDAYFINNLQLSYDLKTKLIKEIGISLLINNIFNVEYETNAWVYRYYYEGEHYVMDGYFPQAGINYFVGLNLKF